MRPEQRLLVLGLIVVVVVGLGVYLYVTPKESSSFRVGKVAFASSVGDDWSYEEKEVFTVGEELWVYAELWGYPTYEVEGGFNVSVSMDILTYDANGDLMDAFSGNLVNILDVVENKDILFMTRSLDTGFLEPGVYTMELVFIDTIESLPLITSKEFRVTG